MDERHDNSAHKEREALSGLERSERNVSIETLRAKRAGSKSKPEQRQCLPGLDQE
jgi:hypothetical protein